MKYFLQLLFLLSVWSLISVSQTPSRNASTFHWNGQASQTANKTAAQEKHLSAQQRAALLKALTNLLGDDPRARQWAAETRLKLVDLNDDGVPEVIAQPVGDICSPTGNCPFWVFQNTASGYKVILEKGAVQAFTIQPTRTNGFSDLVLEMHGSATERELYLYEFTQNRFRRIACYDANWTYLDQNSKLQDLKAPRITPCRR